MRLRAVLTGVLVTLTLLGGASAPAAMAAATPCHFVLGFQTLYNDLPAVVGACVDDQAFAANGDALQHTGSGMLVWRKLDNFTAFTDGHWTWVNGPYGVQRRLNSDRFSWEHDPVTPVSSSVSPGATSSDSSSSTTTTTSGGNTVTVTNTCTAQGSSGSVSATGLNGSTTVVSSDGVTTTSVSNNSSSSSSPGTATASCQHS